MSKRRSKRSESESDMGPRLLPSGSLLMDHDMYSALQMNAAESMYHDQHLGFPTYQNGCASVPCEVLELAELSDDITVYKKWPVYYEDRYDGPPRYDPPPPPKYTPPAQPPWYMRSKITHLPKYNTDADSPLFKVRPWFGVGLKWLDDKTLGGHDNVAVVHEVMPDSPAARAGILPEDQLEFWGNDRLDSKKKWKEKLSKIQLGDRVNIGIHRDGRDSRVVVRITGTVGKVGESKLVISANEVATDN